MVRQYPSRHYQNSSPCDTNISNKKIVYPDNKGLVSILAPTDGTHPSVISHISSVKEGSISVVDAIEHVSYPNKKECMVDRQQLIHTFASSVPGSSKTANLRCHQNDDGGISDTSDKVQKSVHFDKLPCLPKVSATKTNMI